MFTIRWVCDTFDLDVVGVTFVLRVCYICGIVI